ncbi:MAG: DUF3786 domain-containing protein [Clostridiales bacterium]|nr:DUF3786 domain-containing protein [Clostridiales bacterium]MCF8021938.1 DUF3786 domain-containing protein [Clostridiales bacterium]
MLGKNFIIDNNGNITSDCHINPWITIPLLNYSIYSKGSDISGEHILFREMKNVSTRQDLFEKKCIKPLKQIADKDFTFFKNILCILGGKPFINNLIPGTSYVLNLLPKIPLYINYQQQDDNIKSKLNITFDKTSEENLQPELIYILCLGLAIMTEKIASKHFL